MPAFDAVGLGLVAAPALLLVASALLTAWRRRRAPRLPSCAEGSTADQPSLAVLLPVRDELQNIDDCLRCLVELKHRPEVWIVDDGSTDGTSDRVAGWVARAPQLRVLAARELTSGWRGKTNALATGFEQVETPWVLLVDADSRLAPDSAARALAHAQLHRLDAVSLASTQVAGSLGEDLLVPAVFWFLDALLGDWHAAAAAGPAVASGQFILVRTAALRSIGGFSAIRSATLDDVALVAALRSAGGRTGFVRAPDLLSVRMYRSGQQAIAGWRRNFAVILERQVGVLSGTLLLLLASLVALPVGSAWGWMTTLALFALPAGASAINRSSGRQRLWTALLWPVEATVLGWVLLRSARDRRAGRLTAWKGREIALDSDAGS